MTSEFRILTQQEVEECNWGESEELNELFLKHQEKIFQQFGVKRLLSHAPPEVFSHYACNLKTYERLKSVHHEQVSMYNTCVYFRGTMVTIDEFVPDDYISVVYDSDFPQPKNQYLIDINSLLGE